MVQLLQHQVEDAKFLASKPGVRGLFSGMGSGKTLTAIEALADVFHIKSHAKTKSLSCNLLGDAYVPKLRLQHLFPTCAPRTAFADFQCGRSHCMVFGDLGV